MNNDLDELRQRAQPRLEELCRYLLPGGRKEGHAWVCGSIGGEPGDSFDVNLRTGVFGDWAVDDKMDAGGISLWMAVNGLPNTKEGIRRGVRELSAWLGTPTDYEPRQIVEKKVERKDCIFPDCRFPTDNEITELAQRRHVRFEAVERASQRGFLWMFDDARNGTCWLWTDERQQCGLRRRLDGKPFELSSGRSTKSAACVNSVMTEPLGYLEAAAQPSFAVVEGAPDGLAVLDQAIAIGLPHNVAPIVMPCASAKFTTASIAALQGKRGRVFVDNDRAGQKAAQDWSMHLTSAGIIVDAWNFEGVKDLNDYCHLPRSMEPDWKIQHAMSFAMKKAPDMSLQR